MEDFPVSACPGGSANITSQSHDRSDYCTLW